MENGKESFSGSKPGEGRFFDDRIDPVQENCFILELGEEENKRVIDFANRANEYRKKLENNGHLPAAYDGGVSTLNDMKIISEFLKPISNDGAPSFEDARRFIWASNGLNPYDNSETIDADEQDEYFYNLTKRLYVKLQKNTSEDFDVSMVLDNKEDTRSENNKLSESLKQDDLSNDEETKDMYMRVCKILQRHTHIDEGRFWKLAEDETLPIAMRTAGFTKEETRFILSDKNKEK